MVKAKILRDDAVCKVIMLPGFTDEFVHITIIGRSADAKMIAEQFMAAIKRHLTDSLLK